MSPLALDDSLDLLADAVGVAVASVFGMADGDAFAKILRCEPQSRGKLLRRMCGDDFHEDIESAKAKFPPAYVGPIHPPTAKAPDEVGSQTQEKPAETNENPGTVDEDKEAKLPGVTPVPHVPHPPLARRKIVVRNLQKTPPKAHGTRTVVDGERCERIAAAFEERDSPSRWALVVGQITGLDAPGVDLVSFDSEGDREHFRNPETRDVNKVRRFIEVKGRSSSTAKIELKGNELMAARKYGDRYFLYRFYEATDGQFSVSILQNPMAAEEAKATIIELDLDRAKATQRFEFVVEATTSVSNDEDPEPAPVYP